MRPRLVNGVGGVSLNINFDLEVFSNRSDVTVDSGVAAVGLIKLD